MDGWGRWMDRQVGGYRQTEDIDGQRVRDRQVSLWFLVG